MQTSADFERVIVTAAGQIGEALPPERQLIAAKMLTLDAERASVVRSGVSPWSWRRPGTRG